MVRTANQRAASVAAVIVVGLVLTGCSAGGSTRAAAAEATADFVHAVQHGDGGAACALLTRDARSAVETATGSSCAAGILDLDLSVPAPHADTRVYGRAAIVDPEGHTVFLARSGTSWLVRAAGCTPEPDAPYECTVDGS